MEISNSTAQSVLPQDKRIYKIALYGLTGSGKTCLLAALAMSRYSNPAGFNANWLTTPGQTGKEWITKAVEALVNHKRPPPNPNSEKLTFDFGFSHQGRSYNIRMFDYAGELVSPDLSDSENAAKLFKDLAGMDALLVLAPVPTPDQDNLCDIAKDLHGLRRTFASLKEHRDVNLPRFPIALIYNKWDLRSELEHETPENEWKELEEYLQLERPSSRNPYRHIYDDIKSGWTKSDNAKYKSGDLWRAYCNFKNGEPIRCDLMPFPLSAFGEYTVDNQDDAASDYIPKEINPLHSFGLEDPFIWAVYRCQEIEAEIEDEKNTEYLRQLISDLSAIKNNKFNFNLLKFKYISKLNNKAEEFIKHLDKPKTTARQYPELKQRHVERVQQAKNLYAQLLGERWTQIVTIAVTSLAGFILSVLVAEMVVDSYRFSQVQSIVNNPETTQQDELWAEKWQDEYAHSPLWQHAIYQLLQSKPNVEQQLQDSRDRRIERVVKIFVDNNEDPKRRSDFAAEYLKLCHGIKCNRTEEAKKVQQDYLESQDTAVWEKAKVINSEKAINDYLSQYTLGKHAAEARAALSQIISTQAWQNFNADFEEHMKNSEVIEAARMLANRPSSQSPKEVILREVFPDRAKHLLDNKLIEWKDAQHWKEALDYIEQLRQIPREVWDLDQRNAVINEITTQIYQAWDQALYKSVCYYRDTTRMNDYLLSAPIGAMKTEVTKYLQYLNQRSSDNAFHLKLTQVHWNDNVNSRSYVTFILSARGTSVKSEKIDGPSTQKDPSLQLSMEIPVIKYTDTINITIRAVGSGGFLFGESIIGESEPLNQTIQDLVNHGATVALRNEAGKEIGTALLAVEGGVGQEPELPTWRGE